MGGFDKTVPLLFGTILSVIIFSLNWTGVLFGIPDWSISGSGGSPDLEIVARLVDQIVNMLTTMSLSIFFVFGFIVKYIIDKNEGVNVFIFVTGAFFVVSEMISINIGYFARAEMLTLSLNSQAGFDHIRQMLSVQALCVHCAFVCTVIATVHIILIHNRRAASKIALSTIGMDTKVEPRQKLEE